MDWTQIIVVALTVLFGSGGVVVTVIQNGRAHDKKHSKTDGELEKLLEEVRQLKDGQALIKEDLRVSKYATKKQIKYTLTRLHRETVTRGCISRYELECAEDLYTEYQQLKGNSFVGKVMDEMRDLPIRFAEQGEQR